MSSRCCPSFWSVTSSKCAVKEEIPLKTFSRQDARLTLQCLPLVAGVRWRLWRTPFSCLHSQWRLLVQSELDGAAGPHSATFSTPPTPEERAIIDEVWRCAHAVRRAARLVPRGSCLTQAMALQLILARRGQPCSVRIGVDRSPAPDAASSAKNGQFCEGEADTTAFASASASGRFEAHAWVEWRGRVILGGNISRWKPLTIFAPATFSGDKTSPCNE